MDQELRQKLNEQERKIDAIYRSVERTRRYFLITAWVTILAIIVPLVGLMFVIPSFISNYNTTIEGITN